MAVTQMLRPSIPGPDPKSGTRKNDSLYAPRYPGRPLSHTAGAEVFVVVGAFGGGWFRSALDWMEIGDEFRGSVCVRGGDDVRDERAEVGEVCEDEGPVVTA